MKTEYIEVDGMLINTIHVRHITKNSWGGTPTLIIRYNSYTAATNTVFYNSISEREQDFKLLSGDIQLRPQPNHIKLSGTTDEAKLIKEKNELSKL